MAWESFRPRFQKGVVDDITIEQRKQSDDWGTGVFELVVLPENGLTEEDEPQEEGHDPEQEHEEVVPWLGESGGHEIEVIGVLKVLKDGNPCEHDTKANKYFLVPEDDKFSNDKVVKDGNKCTKELKEVTGDNDNKPEIKELEFIKESELIPVFIPIKMRVNFIVLDLRVLMLLRVVLVGHVVSGDGVDLFPGEGETDRADQENCEVDGEERLFSGEGVFVDAAAERVGFEGTVDVGEGFEGVCDGDGPVETRVVFWVLVDWNVCDYILDLKVHVLYVLQEALHPLRVVHRQVHVGQLVRKLVLVALDNHMVQILFSDLWVIDFEAIGDIVDTGVLE